MSIPAREAKAGKLYRLTRDSGTTYYRICDGATARRLEKRLSVQNVQTMSADDRRTLQTLVACRTQEHVLGQRIIRYQTERGDKCEMKAYIAFPPDYQLREVAKPPGYAVKRAQRLKSEEQEESEPVEEGERTDAEEYQEADDSGETSGAGCEGAG